MSTNNKASKHQFQLKMIIDNIFKKIDFKIIFIIIFLILNLITLSDYSLSWDETIHIDRGKEVFDFLLQKKTPLSFSPHGVFVDTIGYLSILIFHNKLNVLPFDASFHLPILPIAALGLWALMKFVQKYIGKEESIISAIVLCTMPRFIGHLHQNIKDIPEASFFTLAILAFSNLIEKKEGTRLKRYAFAIISFGLALAVKINAIQIIPIILFWLLIKTAGEQKKKNFNIWIKKTLSIFFPKAIIISLTFLLGALLTILLWPNLWTNPLNEGKNVFFFFGKVWRGNPILYFGNLYHGGINIPWHYAAGYLLVTTPILTIITAILGIYISFKKLFKENTIYALMLLWFFIPLLKYIIPNVPIYDDIRQYMEVLYPLSIFSAITIVILYKKINVFLKKNLTKPMYKISIILYLSLFAYYLFVPLMILHPYEMIYFNSLVGHKKGVYERGLFDVDFWSISIKEATLWVNDNAKKNSIITYPFGEHIAYYYIRPDLKISYEDFDNAEYLIIQNRQTFMNSTLEHILQNRKPIYTITRRDAPLCWIYKLN